MYQTDVFREVWTRLKNSRPGTGGSDWCVKRDQEQVWKHPQTGHCTYQSFSKHGADTTGFGRHFHWPQPEVPRVAGTVLPKLLMWHDLEMQLVCKTSVLLCRMNLAIMQKLKSCCVRMVRLCSVPSTSSCPVSIHWSTKQWRILWWLLNSMKMQGEKPWSLQLWKSKKKEEIPMRRLARIWVIVTEP